MRINTTIRPGLVKFDKQDYFALYVNHLNTQWNDDVVGLMGYLQHGFSEWFSELVDEVINHIFYYTNPTGYLTSPEKLSSTAKHVDYLIENNLTVGKEKAVIKALMGLEQHFIRMVVSQFEFTNHKTDFWGRVRNNTTSIVYCYQGDFRILEWENNRSKADWVGKQGSSLSVDFTDGEWHFGEDGELKHVTW